MDRQGHYRTIGRDERAYRSFVPTPLQDIHLEMDEEMQTLLAQAHERLKNRNLSDMDALQKEEVENSVNLVYGEKKSLALAFFETDDKEDKEDKKRKLDKQNLLQATRFAVERMQKLPISSRLLKDVHWVMMQGEHNERKYPGEMRTSPIWLGTKDDTQATAPFIPPVYEDMAKSIADLENYIHYEEQTDALIMAALIHYQFEMIHPFIDGNGRIGRLLTLLFLMDRNVIQQPVLSLSKNLMSSSFKYFTSIASVEVSGTYEKWVKYFLQQLH